MAEIVLLVDSVAESRNVLDFNCVEAPTKVHYYKSLITVYTHILLFVQYFSQIAAAIARTLNDSSNKSQLSEP
jgi:hypothetical protein